MKKIGNKSVLQAFLEDMGDTRKEGEQTLDEIRDALSEQGFDMTLEAVRCRLKRMIESKKITMRKAFIKGRRMNLYSGF